MTGIVAVVCRPPSVAGFALAGVTAEPIGDAVDPGPPVASLLARTDLGVLLIEESIYQLLPPEVRRRLDRSARPVVVPFPGPAWQGGGQSAEERVVELLRRAIGYRVRLQ